MSKINSASILTIVFLLGILVMVNTIGIRYFLRADLTSSQIYSLSKASKDIVANIQDKLLVKAYFSPNLPGIYGGIERYLRDMLEDYRAYSRGHLVYEFIDPGSEQELEKEAQKRCRRLLVDQSPLPSVRKRGTAMEPGCGGSL